MDFNRIKEKLNILADAAKYDVSCSKTRIMVLVTQAMAFAIPILKMVVVFHF